MSLLINLNLEDIAACKSLADLKALGVTLEMLVKLVYEKSANEKYRRTYNKTKNVMYKYVKQLIADGKVPPAKA